MPMWALGMHKRTVLLVSLQLRINVQNIFTWCCILQCALETSAADRGKLAWRSLIRRAKYYQSVSTDVGWNLHQKCRASCRGYIYRSFYNLFSALWFMKCIRGARCELIRNSNCTRYEKWRQPRESVSGVILHCWWAAAARIATHTSF